MSTGNTTDKPGIYPSCTCVCNEHDWMGSTVHIPTQELPDNGGTLREQRIIARDLPDDLRGTFEGALDYLLTLAPGAWGASIIRIERREACLRLYITRDGGKIDLEPLKLDLGGADYLEFFDTLTNPEFLLNTETKTI